VVQRIEKIASTYISTADMVILIRQENSDIVFPPISAKDAEMDGAP
jgi:hypothetical protein